MRFSTAADQEEEGSSGWAAMPRCSAFFCIHHECPGAVTPVGRSLAATREGTSPSPLRTLLNFTKGSSCGTPARLHNVPQFSRLTLLSFHCLLRATEAKPLRWCNVRTFDVSLSTRYDKVSGIVNISRMASHTALLS